jgi:ATP-binding cassette, subfamily C, bacterial PrsD
MWDALGTTMSGKAAESTSRSEAAVAVSGFYMALLGVGLFSAVINLLYLTGSFYMLQIYDRVIPSRSISTLVALSVLAATLYVGQGLLDFLRARILVRIARSLDERLSPRVFTVLGRLPLLGRTGGHQPLRDLDQMRSFLAGGGPLGFFDLPWMPFYIAICFFFHPLIGFAALFGATILIVITLCTEALTRKPVKAAALHGAARASVAEATRRNAEVLAAMGMAGHVAAIWQDINQKHLRAQEKASDVAGSLTGVSKTMRMGLQSAVLGIGAYLVIQGEASSGIIIAGSILAARSLAPIELVLAHWKGFVSARQSWTRLQQLFAMVQVPESLLSLPRPFARLSLDNVIVVAPGEQRVVVSEISFTLEAGSGLGIIGPSASGKSCLARALVGIWTPARGSVRLDGATHNQWTPEKLGRDIGYLPQDIELFDGTIGQNIARFDPTAEAAVVIRAAEQAGVHEMIVGFPKGYETQIGEAGTALSAGQRQRIALARALYGEPFLVVLDEPNSNLDAEGEQALTRAIVRVRERGGIAVLIAHRPSALAAVDHVLVMANGTAKAFGPRDQVLRPAVHAVPAVAIAGGA